MPRAPEPRLSVVVPTLGREGKLRRGLERLAQQIAAEASAFEVIVASDALDPDPVATSGLVGVPEGWRHVQAPVPGASAARNMGWRAARAPLILFLDDDILAGGELVAEHLAAHAAEPQERTCVLGDVRWARDLRITPFMRWVDDGLQFDYHGLRDGQDAGWGRMYTANLSLKRSLLERLGGFDEAGFPYLYEDLDLARRARDSGGLVVRYRRAASAGHLGATTLEDWLVRVELLAAAEHAFVARYPDVTPHFREIFLRAAAAPPARGRGRLVAGLVPRGTPVVGARVWASAQASYAQALAPRFLAAWDRAAEASPHRGAAVVD